MRSVQLQNCDEKKKNKWQKKKTVSKPMAFHTDCDMGYIQTHGVESSNCCNGIYSGGDDITVNLEMSLDWETEEWGGGGSSIHGCIILG